MVRWLRFPVAIVAVLAVFSTVAPAAGAARVPRLKHVWVFVMENHSFGQIIGSTHAPYVTRLARRHGMATRMWAVTHPSLPNYLAMISGSPHGCNNNSCERGIRGKTLAGQFARHGLGWRGYFEELPRRGYTGDDVGNYVQHHNPFVYFRSVTSHPRQLRHLRKMQALRPSLRRPPALSFIVPNNAHNMHDGSIRAGDRWLSRWVSRVQRSHAYRRHGVIIITWDEGHNDSSGCCLPSSHGGRIPLFIISRHARTHHRLTHPATTYTLLRMLESGFRVPHLGLATQARPLPRAW